MDDADTEGPDAYVEGFMQFDRERILSSLRDAPSQAALSWGNSRWTLLHACCYEEGWPDVAEVLVRLGADVNARDHVGRTPMHHAANLGQLAVIEVLARAGADLSIRDEEGMTPLMWGEISRTGRNREVIAMLRAHGA